jgi:hypothetical protein
MSANNKQVGGKHYIGKTFQPWDVITAWGLGFLDGNAVKYISRWRDKGGIEDLEKAIHYLSKLIETERARLEAEEQPDRVWPGVPDGTAYPQGDSYKENGFQ